MANATVPSRTGVSSRDRAHQLATWPTCHLGFALSVFHIQWQYLQRGQGSPESTGRIPSRGPWGLGLTCTPFSSQAWLCL
jgi:hypothetical protein